MLMNRRVFLLLGTTALVSLPMIALAADGSQ